MIDFFKLRREQDEPASPDEKDMAMKQAEFIGYVAREIGEHLEANKEFPEWMQNKLSALHEKAKGLHASLGAHGGPEDMDEKLDPKKHDMGDYIKDFQKSDAPQFKGASKEKRRKMAIAAYLDDTGQSKK